MAMVLAPPPAAGALSCPPADHPLVLTTQERLKQLSAANFPVPASL